MAGVFESKDAYISNSGTPERRERFRRLRELMEGDPEWRDGEIVVAHTTDATVARAIQSPHARPRSTPCRPW